MVFDLLTVDLGRLYFRHISNKTIKIACAEKDVLTIGVINMHEFRSTIAGFIAPL